MDISIGILAGGKSTRFGQDKAFVKFQDKNFLDTIINEFSSFEDIIVSVDSKEKFKNIPYLLVEDFYKNIGPIEGIRQILLNSKNTYSFICATDMPFIKKEIIDYLKQFISSDYNCYVITTNNKVHPLCALYSKDSIDILENSIKSCDYKIINLLSKLKTKYIPLEYSCFSDRIIKNINTLDDYKKSKLPYIFCISGVKNSGKTTLIVKLLDILKKKFSKIAVIKHDGHDFNIDHKGTDTYRFLESGANQISIFSKNKFAQIIKASDTKIEEIVSQAKNNDIIIIEGLKFSSYPKIEIIREGISTESICAQDTLIAIATNEQTLLSENKNTVSLDDINAIYELISKYFNL